MAKKPTLGEQLQNALMREEYLKGQVSTLKQELSEEKERAEKQNRDRMDSFSRISSEAVESNRQLMEVIRWHVAPETAQRPDFIGPDEEFRRRGRF